MPPKKTNSGASKKAEVKKKEKVIEVSLKNLIMLSFFEMTPFRKYFLNEIYF